MFQVQDVLRQNSMVWDLYTRKEEYHSHHLDQHDRFISAHGAYQDILDPAVSRYLIHNGFRPDYPEDKPFAVCLTHDVDEVYPPYRHILLSSMTCLKKLDFTRLRRQVSWKLHEKEKSPYRNFREIMDLEKKYGACSSFYFLATHSDIRRFRYNIEDLEDELVQIHERGWEVGLHGGYYAFNDLEEILREKKRLEQVLDKKVIGYRNHYLRFQVPGSWENLTRAGFLYDTTLGYHDRAGFRNGMCHPFHPYNLNTEGEVNILEIPLSIMDVTMFDLGKSSEEVWNLVKRLIDTAASYRGVICLNWHNDSFNCPFKNTRKIMYEKILEYCYSKNAWMTSGENIYSWWKKNEY